MHCLVVNVGGDRVLLVRGEYRVDLSVVEGISVHPSCELSCIVAKQTAPESFLLVGYPMLGSGDRAGVLHTFGGEVRGNAMRVRIGSKAFEVASSYGSAGYIFGTVYGHVPSTARTAAKRTTGDRR